MNNTTFSDPNSDTGGFLGSGNIGGFGYGIGVSVGILLLITTITLASYFCTRNQTSELPPRRQRTVNQNELSEQHCVVEIGIDEKTLLSYPKLLYSEAKVNHKDSTASCCSICLADYKKKDMLRLLPDCGHLFHLKCVDPWLMLNPSCPVCRTSPLPTPQSTPLAEVVPFATRPLG
ncbi:PREDICTED: RING-H2 finger protein ATL70-like [Nicotiana attenuata]|uniref:Ring-h2 finger protein atl70 n=1 Tax=Nicotiana attenuata TaxID=49451 RepID=A0A314L084_NICAT|nr:PREDICTED: RING-H2 finger protein ATL70-like [Nicotiana attenuata]OIT35071.1 ring-h2 finger protein atl70 [Nicotiana attenuata]